VLKVKVDEQTFVHHLVQTFGLKFSDLHSEPRTSNHGQPRQSRIPLKLNFCQDNGIILDFVPPHISHKIYPLDVSFFGPLKSAYNRKCGLFMVSHVHEKIRTEDISSLLNTAYQKIAIMGEAASGLLKQAFGL
jgi:hypothetical protein